VDHRRCAYVDPPHRRDADAVTARLGHRAARHWHGPALELTSPDNSFTKVLTPGGEIRQTTSTEDDGTAHVTLRYGSEAEFEAACRVPLRN
jgi:purine nucleoside permease